MSSHTITVAVPEPLYDHFRRRAALRRRSVEDEIVLALAEAIPTQDELPEDLAETLASMAALDDGRLWQLARSRVASDDAARLADLGGKRQRTGLTDDEMREAEDLVQRHDRVMVIRAEAAALLKQRGHDVDALDARV